MLTNDLCRSNRTPGPYFGMPEFRVTRLGIQQVKLTTDLCETIQDEAFWRYLLPGNEMRRRLLPQLLCSVARSSQLFGEIRTSEVTENGAVFVSRGDNFSLERLARAVISTASFKLSWSSFRRCINVCARLDGAHERLAMGPHWYLMCLGVTSSRLRDASAMFKQLLSRADSDGLPCYLETFRQTDLSFFKDFGFRVEGAGTVPGGGPNFWAMWRLPQ